MVIVTPYSYPPQELDSVSPTAVEYGTALLMNLCLRSAGRAAAAAPALVVPLLRLCEGLLDTPNEQVQHERASERACRVCVTLYICTPVSCLPTCVLCSATPPPPLRPAAAHPAPPRLPAVYGPTRPQVRTYTHGILYSVFSRPEVRAAAAARGTSDLLEATQQSAPQQFAAQVGGERRRGG